MVSWEVRSLNEALAADGQGVLPSAIRLSYDMEPLGALEHIVLTPEAQP